jgi:hypothetical protein
VFVPHGTVLFEKKAKLKKCTRRQVKAAFGVSDKRGDSRHGGVASLPQVSLGADTLMRVGRSQR